MHAQARPPLDFVERHDATVRLAALDRELARDLEVLGLRPATWVPEHRANGRPLVDVLIVGGGMCGALAWHALRSSGITRMRIADRNPAGREGPWMTYARMETLRSPKQLTGPAYGLPNLCFRSWFEARFGSREWQRLDKIPRPMWNDYLGWYRRVLDVPVENDVEVTRIGPAGPWLDVELRHADGDRESVVARRVIMATGREGTGQATIPDFATSLPPERWAHSSADIDFAGLRDRRVTVVGIGASAVDNAAEALEAGAREVRFLIRRSNMPRINKMMGIGSFGFTAGYASLNDAWRWRFMHYSFATQTPAPRDSTLRVSRHDNAYFHFNAAIESVDARVDALAIRLARGESIETDFMILGTGFDIDPLARHEFGDAAGDIRLWEDVYTPPDDEADSQLGRFPYLSPDFSFQPRDGVSADWLTRVHCFNYGASASLGKVSGDIPGISDGAAWLARELAAAMYREDIETHWRRMQEYDKPELLGDEWTATTPAETDADRPA